MSNFVNHVTISAPRNGTTSHTVDPASGTVVGGAAFTPTAGRFLLVIVTSGATSTTPTGWTLPTNGDNVSTVGLYVWYRTAAGGDTFTTSHGGASNYPVVFDIYEYAPGTTFVSAVKATNVSGGAANPTLSGLTGTNDVFYVAAQYAITTDAGATYSFAWSVGTEVTDAYVTPAATDGWALGVAVSEGFTGASSTSTPTVTQSLNTRSHEATTFAIKPTSLIAPYPLNLEDDTYMLAEDGTSIYGE